MPRRAHNALPPQDECRQWDINEVVFTPAMWPTYEPLLRADFRLFDEYAFSEAGGGGGGGASRSGDSSGGSGGAAGGGDSMGSTAPPPFDFPIIAFWGAADRRITRVMVEGWRRFTAGSFEAVGLAGANHLWPSNSRDAKAAWLARVVAEMAALCE
jgi:surfactin synthase thioesterase subunit